MTQLYSHHIFICTQQRFGDRVYCENSGAQSVYRELKRQVAEHDLQGVEISTCGCLGLCGHGPAMVIYPQGTWYAPVTPEDVEQIVTAHLQQGQVVERLRIDMSDAGRREAVARQKARNQALDRAQRKGGVLPEHLRRLASDFQASRAFLSAVELDLFTAVGDGADAAAVAEQVGAAPRACETLLNALCAIGLLHKRDGRFSNTPDTARFLRRGQPDDARAALMHRVNMWDGWSTLTDCVREGSPLRPTTGAPSTTQAYIAATHRIAAVAAPAIVDALKLSQLNSLLDLGCGSGAYSVAFLQAFAEAQATLMDLPRVIRVANRHIREAGLEARATLRAGDFMVDPLGSGHDLVLLSYVMHLGSPRDNLRLLERVASATTAGGRVVINDYVMRQDKTLPRGAALYGLTMLVSSHGGNVYSLEEYSEWLEQAGFGEVEQIPLVGPTDVVTARKLQKTFIGSTG